MGRLTTFKPKSLNMKPILALLLFPFSMYAQNQSSNQATINGEITYFLADEGNKPDFGSTVYIVEVSKIPEFNKALSDSFYHCNYNRNLRNSYTKMHVPPPPDVMQEIHKYAGDNEETFKGLDEQNSGQISIIQINEDTEMLMADGKGSYTASVNPGIYYIYIRSNHSNGDSRTESMGKVYCEMVEVKKGKTVDVSHLFDQY